MILSLGAASGQPMWAGPPPASVGSATLQIDDDMAVSSQRVAVGQYVNPSLATRIQSVGIGEPG